MTPAAHKLVALEGRTVGPVGGKHRAQLGDKRGLGHVLEHRSNHRSQFSKGVRLGRKMFFIAMSSTARPDALHHYAIVEAPLSVADSLGVDGMSRENSIFCRLTPLRLIHRLRRLKKPVKHRLKQGAGNETRTRDLNLGKIVLQQA